MAVSVVGPEFSYCVCVCFATAVRNVGLIKFFIYFSQKLPVLQPSR